MYSGSVERKAESGSKAVIITVNDKKFVIRNYF